MAFQFFVFLFSVSATQSAGRWDGWGGSADWRAITRTADCQEKQTQKRSCRHLAQQKKHVNLSTAPSIGCCIPFTLSYFVSAHAAVCSGLGFGYVALVHEDDLFIITHQTSVFIFLKHFQCDFLLHQGFILEMVWENRNPCFWVRLFGVL